MDFDERNDLARQLAVRHGWVQGLARSLVVDESASQDLIQEAWLAAERHPPKNVRAVRSWVRCVLVNFARIRHREAVSRDRREKAAARPEKLSTSPHEVLERAEMQQQLVRRVLELEEPYRSTILLRFFEEMTPAEIALHQEVPASTVRSRLTAALAHLRARLEREDRAGRAAWRAKLVLIAGGTAAGIAPGRAAASAIVGSGGAAATSAIATGGTIMAAKAILAVGAAGALVLAAATLGPKLVPSDAEELRELREKNRQAAARIETLEREAKARDRALSELGTRSVALAAALGAPQSNALAGTGVDASAAAKDTDTEDSESIHELLDDPNGVERFALTDDEIEATVEKHGRDAAYLVAAARLTQDLGKARAYLEEALAKDPKSPSALLALLDVQIRAQDSKEAITRTVEALAEADPGNLLANVHLANLKAAAGDMEGAMAEMRKAASKPRTNDYSAKHFGLLQDFYRDAGHGAGLSKVLAAWGMRVENLLSVRDVGVSLSDQAGKLFEAGDATAALEAVHIANELAQKVKSSGRTILEEAVGTQLQVNALEQEKMIFSSRGDLARVEEIQALLETLAQSRKRNQRIAGSVFAALRQLPASEVSHFLDRLYAEGEAAAAADLPGVREAIEAESR